MTDRDPEDDDASDWLASQFDPTGELPKQKKPDPVAPTTPDAAAGAGAPPPAQPPGQPSGQPLPPQAPLQPRMPPAPQPPLQPQAPPAPARPVAPAQPAAPAFPMPPAPAPQSPQPPAFPPAAAAPPTPPQQPLPPFPTTPTQPSAPVPPATPQQPSAPATPEQPPGGFSWGLNPGAPSDVPPAAATPPPVTTIPPPVTPTPPIAPATPPAATPPPVDPFPASAATAPPPDPFAFMNAGPAETPPTPIPPAATPPATTPPAPPAATPPAATPSTPVEPAGPFYRPVAHEPAPLDPAIDGVPSVEAEPPATAMPFETTVLPDVAPDSADAPPFWEPEPTQMMDAVEFEPDPPARVPQPVPTSVFPPQTRATEAFGLGDAAADGGPTDTEQVSAIDALFGDNQFREYTEGLDPSQNPFVRKAEADAGRGPVDPSDPMGPQGPPPGVSKVQRILLSVLGGILAILAIVALFFVGARLPDLLGPSPAIVSPTGTPSPSASPGVALGPVAPGEYAWNELLGGECLDPYVDPWQPTYVVVDCGVAHPAEMVHRGVIPEDETGSGLYPGEDVIQAQALVFCRGSGIFDPAQVSGLTDAVVQASYPTEEVWNDGGRDYFCFVTLASGEPITGSVSLPQVAPAEPAP